MLHLYFPGLGNYVPSIRSRTSQYRHTGPAFLHSAFCCIIDSGNAETKVVHNDYPQCVNKPSKLFLRGLIKGVVVGYCFSMHIDCLKLFQSGGIDFKLLKLIIFV